MTASPWTNQYYADTHCHLHDATLDEGVCPVCEEEHEAIYGWPEPEDCRTCGGSGDVRHPRWGRIDCPEQYATCPTCRGTGAA